MMSDERFNLLKSEKLKNSRGRKWVDLNDVEESSEESAVESNDDVSSNYSEDSFRELDDEDIVDVDFDNLLKNAQSTSDSTNKLAVMHFDFDQYPLSYLANIIKHALPKNGKIKSITKYPSQEYMDRYHDDLKYGPKEYLKSEENNDDKDYDSDESCDSNKANKVYRKYQISRLKFFYAIFQFDSIETADAIYEMLDEKMLGDTGLKLDLRYVDDDKKFEIPDEFLHLVEKLRPNFSKLKAIDFKPSCFSQLKVRDMWDVVPQKELFNKRAFEVSDNELSDVEQFYREDTASEFSSASETEAGSNNEEDNDGPKVKRYRKQRMDVEEYRALLGLTGEMKENNNQSGGVDIEEEEAEEEVESIGEGSDEEDEEEYVINEEGVDDEEEDISESEEENEDNKKTTVREEDKSNREKKQTKKISHREKTKSILKEKLQKKKSKQKEIRDYLKSVVVSDSKNNEDRFDEFVLLPQKFKLTMTNARYENAKLFSEMMKYRADKLGIVPDFVVPSVSDDDAGDDGDDDYDCGDQKTRNQPRKRSKHNRKHSLAEPDLKKIKI